MPRVQMNTVYTSYLNVTKEDNKPLKACSPSQILANEKGFLSLLLPVNVEGFRETEGNPGPQKHHVVTEDHDTNEEASSQDQSLVRVCILSLHAERRQDIQYNGGHNLYLVCACFVCVVGICGTV